MSMLVKTFELLRRSIVGSDILILGCAILDLVFLILSIWGAKNVKKEAKEWEVKRNQSFSKFWVHTLSKFNTLFVTILSLFPLLGMLGTVFGLLGLDLATGDMENIKNNFFIALTSTAWGIIFSVLFKLVYAFFTDDIEEQIATAKKLSEDV